MPQFRDVGAVGRHATINAVWCNGDPVNREAIPRKSDPVPGGSFGGCLTAEEDRVARQDVRTALKVNERFK